MYTAPRGPVGIAMLVLLAIMVLTVFLYESCNEGRAAVALSADCRYGETVLLYECVRCLR